jgi:hypothetical protein
MKTKRNHALVASFLIVGLSAVSTQAALTIGFVPTNQTVPLGSNPQVDLVATFDAIPSPAERLGGWDLILSYDASIVSFTSASFGTALGNSLTWVTPGVSLVSLGEISLDSPVPAQPLSFTLATLTFSADSVGFSDLLLTVGQGGLTTGGTPGGLTNNGIPPRLITDAVLNSGRITVRQPTQGVPEGGNLAIVALPTLLGLMFLSKRMKNAKP